MTQQETATILEAIKVTFPNFEVKEKEKQLEVWHMMFKNSDYNKVSRALQTFLDNDTKGFAPSIGQIKGIMRDQDPNKKTYLSDSEAWDMVMRALVSIGSYDDGGKELFNSFPIAVQRAAGGTRTLFNMSKDENFNENVASSNFKRCYNILIEREKQDELLGIGGDFGQKTIEYAS